VGSSVLSCLVRVILRRCGWRELNMELPEVLGRAAEAAQVRRVFGEPIEREGLVVVPAAVVRGGAGGGSGRRPRDGGGEGEGEGAGGGYGFIARPAGVFVIRDGQVEWRPALDLGRVILGGQLVAIAVLLVLRAFLRGRG
jgi:uncharacterized spore protein YtfJ